NPSVGSFPDGPGRRALVMPRLAFGLFFVLAVLVVLGGFLVFRPRSESAEPSPAGKPARDLFAADRASTAEAPLAFDAQRARRYLEDLCKIGPRVSGSAGMKQQQERLKSHFESLGGRVEFQRFSARQKSQRQPVDMANLIVSWFPERERRVLLCSHY